MVGIGIFGFSPNLFFLNIIFLIFSQYLLYTEGTVDFFCILGASHTGCKDRRFVIWGFTPDVNSGFQIVERFIEFRPRNIDATKSDSILKRRIDSMN